jgi:nitrogen fixation/metabolism regulation signal transduction histidine kinase
VGSIIEAQSQSVENSMYLVALAAIIILVLTAALVTSTITRPLVRLSRVVKKMEDGELDSENLNMILNQRIEDEVTKLAQVFKKMAVQVQLRETKLKRQIEELNIQIDEQKKAKQVAEITETDYFQNLRSNALGMRNRFKGRDST